jgi:hypothetical protein
MIYWKKISDTRNQNSNVLKENTIWRVCTIEINQRKWQFYEMVTQQIDNQVGLWRTFDKSNGLHLFLFEEHTYLPSCVKPSRFDIASWPSGVYTLLTPKPKPGIFLDSSKSKTSHFLYFLGLTGILTPLNL